MKRVLVLAIALSVLCLASVASAAGPHDMDCMECHSTHYAKADYAIGVQPLNSVENPARTRTQMNVAAIDALCLGCHNENEGILPVNMHSTHPSGIKPVYTRVPNQLLKDGMFSCVSCHNPHPSNTNAKYLIVDTAKDGMGVFCAKCHPAQSDPETVTASNNQRIKSDGEGAPIVRINSAAAAPAKQ